MGVLESLATVAAALSSIIGLVYWFNRRAERARLEEITRQEQTIAAKIQNAKTDSEREAYAKELYEIRSHR